MKARAAQLQGVHATLSDLSSTALVEADLCRAYAEAVDHLREAFVAARARRAARGAPRLEAAPPDERAARREAGARGRARAAGAAAPRDVRPLHFAAAAAASAAAAAARARRSPRPPRTTATARPACPPARFSDARLMERLHAALAAARRGARGRVR